MLVTCGGKALDDKCWLNWNFLRQLINEIEEDIRREGVTGQFGKLTFGNVSRWSRWSIMKLIL